MKCIIFINGLIPTIFNDIKIDTFKEAQDLKLETLTKNNNKSDLYSERSQIYDQEQKKISEYVKNWIINRETTSEAIDELTKEVSILNFSGLINKKIKFNSVQGNEILRNISFKDIINFHTKNKLNSKKKKKELILTKDVKVQTEAVNQKGKSPQSKFKKISDNTESLNKKINEPSFNEWSNSTKNSQDITLQILNKNKLDSFKNITLNLNNENQLKELFTYLDNSKKNYQKNIPINLKVVCSRDKFRTIFVKKAPKIINMQYIVDLFRIEK